MNIENNPIRCIAFDCFGTVFDMSGISRDEINAYVSHVNSDNFSEFKFPKSWWDIKAHPDSADGIRRLRNNGYVCITLSNGSAKLLKHVSDTAGIQWDHIVDLASHRAYKPNNKSAYLAASVDTGIPPKNILLVTANPTFGDIEGAAAAGMRSQVIRREGECATITELKERLQRATMHAAGRAIDTMLDECPAELISFVKEIHNRYSPHGDPKLSAELFRIVEGIYKQCEPHGDEHARRMLSLSIGGIIAEHRDRSGSLIRKQLEARITPT